MGVLLLTTITDQQLLLYDLISRWNQFMEQASMEVQNDSARLVIFEYCHYRENVEDGEITIERCATIGSFYFSICTVIYSLV